MKYLILTLTMFIIILSGCGSANKADGQVVAETQENMESTFKIGKVYLDEDGCDVFIITEEVHQQKLYPVGLEDMFLVNKAVLQFEYDLSRAPLPEGCKDCRAVVLRNVTELRGSISFLLFVSIISKILTIFPMCDKWSYYLCKKFIDEGLQQHT